MFKFYLLFRKTLHEIASICILFKSILKITISKTAIQRLFGGSSTIFIHF